MSTPSDPRHELASTYAVSDRANREEMERLQLQDRLLTISMGGVLPEQSDPGRFERVLDVGCGTGGWLIETASTYPGISQLIGIDISEKMLAYARTQAVARQVDQRVQFLTMDVLQGLAFPAGHFDLINQRLGLGYLRTWDWGKLLQEYLRIARVDGVIRITESEIAPQHSSSAALMQLSELLLQALYQAGHFFSAKNDAVTEELPRLLQHYGVRDIQVRTYPMEHQPGSAEAKLALEDVKYLYRTIKPFLQKWTRVPDDYEAIYQQMLNDMQQPDFVGRSNVVTAWGTKPAPVLGTGQIQ